MIFGSLQSGHSTNGTKIIAKSSAAGIAALILVFNVLVSTPMSASATKIDGACNCVVFRLDDIQDYFLNTVQPTLIDHFMAKNEKLSLALIMNALGDDATVVNKVRQGLQSGDIEIVSHAWNHVDYAKLAPQVQHDTLQQSLQKMTSIFGKSTVTFIPPYNSYNDDTISALKSLGIRVISAEFDLEPPSIYDHDNPTSDANKVFKAIPGSDITDTKGIYHLPQEIGFYTYDADPPTKTPVSLIESNIDSTIAAYGYIVITLHPQDFAVKNASQNPINQINPKEVADLDTIFDYIHSHGYTTKSFADVARIKVDPVPDTTPPSITAPLDLNITSSQTLTQIDAAKLGNPSVIDNADPNPTIKNDAPAAGFPQGTTKVTWTVSDHANPPNSAVAYQYVTIKPQADNVRPLIQVDTPPTGITIHGPTTGVNLRVTGTASDKETGIKRVEVKPFLNTVYSTANPKSDGDWSTWSYVLSFSKSGDYDVIARAQDFWGNYQWSDSTIKVVLDGAYNNPLQILKAPVDITVQATGIKTPVQLPPPEVFDVVDLNPTITHSFSAGASESGGGFPLGTTEVTWTISDSLHNSISVKQRVTVEDKTAPSTPQLESPLNNIYTSSGAIAFNWKAVVDPVSDVTYELLVANNPSFASSVAISQTGLTSPTFTNPTALPDGTYYWKVRASDTSQNKSPYSETRIVVVDTSSAAVKASPPGASFNVPPTVTLSTTQKGATIYYTTDGNTPSAGSAVYSAPIPINGNTDLKFIAKDSTGALGKVFTESYIIDTTLPIVTASPPGGAYNTNQKVTLTATGPASTIYYTTDGGTPSAGSAVYSGQISISKNTTLKFIAIAGDKNSAVKTQIYTFDTASAKVTASPAGGTYNSAQSIVLTSDKQATIYYTTDGTAPTIKSAQYFTQISISGTTTLKFISKDAAGNTSPISTEVYTISIPVISGGGGGGGYIGGGGGGGGGGSFDTVDLTPLYPDSHFVQYPLDRIKFTSFGASNQQQQNVPTTTVKQGQQVNIFATFKNFQNSPQNYVYITQVEKNGITVSIDWVTGAVDEGQTETASRSWTPEQSGDYVIKVFVWNKLTGAPNALSEVGVLGISAAGPQASATASSLSQV